MASTVSGSLRVPVVLPTGNAAKITREQTYEMPVRSLGQEDPVEEGMVTCLENPMDRGVLQAI